jgi:hypothetical protein
VLRPGYGLVLFVLLMRYSSLRLELGWGGMVIFVGLDFCFFYLLFLFFYEVWLEAVE